MMQREKEGAYYKEWEKQEDMVLWMIDLITHKLNSIEIRWIKWTRIYNFDVKFLQFHIEQARMRSKIRIADGRAKPIDLLAQYINPDEDNLEYQMHEPYSVLVVGKIFDISGASGSFFWCGCKFLYYQM